MTNIIIIIVIVIVAVVVVVIVISNSNWTEWSTIQTVIARVIAFTSTITP